MKAVRLLVSGSVQGVGFRWSVEREARAAGVSGWVRNLDDGRVEAWVEGDGAAVDEVVAFCRRGPDAATVGDVAVSDVEPEGLDAFRIR